MAQCAEIVAKRDGRVEAEKWQWCGALAGGGRPSSAPLRQLGLLGNFLGNSKGRTAEVAVAKGLSG